MAFFTTLASSSVRAGKSFVRDECSTLAASIAFFSGVSLFPALAVLVAAVGLFLQVSELGGSAEQAVLEATSSQLSPAFQQYVRDLLTQVRVGSLVSGPASALALLFSALVGFVQLDRAFNIISGRAAEKKETKTDLKTALVDFLATRLAAFVALGILGFVVLFSTALDLAVGLLLDRLPELVERYLPALPGLLSPLTSLIVPLVVSALAVTLIYRWIPREPPSWLSALVAATAVAVLWALSRRLLALWLTSRGLDSAYGVLGTVLLLQFWIYYAALALLFGAELAYELDRSGGALEPELPDS